MLNALAFVAMFVIGGLSGIFMAATPVDIYIHDTYFIVAHLHYVLFMSSIFGIFAGIYFWFPKMFGRMMNEPLGKVHFALTFVFANCTFFPMHIIGIGGHPRRYFDSTHVQHLGALPAAEPVHDASAPSCWASRSSSSCSTSSAACSAARSPAAIPWHSNTLEWTAPSPPPHGNFETIADRPPRAL